MQTLSNKKFALVLLLATGALYSHAQEIAISTTSQAAEAAPQVKEEATIVQQPQQKETFFDNIFSSMHKHMEEMQQKYDVLFDQMRKSNETIFNQAQFPTIQVHAKDTDEAVVIAITVGQDAQKVLDPKKIDITLPESTHLQGKISLENGVIDFIVAPHYIQVVENAEVKQERKTADDTIESVVIGHNKSSFAQSLPARTDFSNITAQVNANILTLTLGKKKATKINVVAA